MTSTCKFEFDHSDLTYYSGECMNGRIVLQTTKEKQVKAICIQFEGQGKVRWDERMTHRKDGRTHTYIECFCADEKYFTSKTNVRDAGLLSVGTHIYTFNIALPEDCPSTCTESYGKICYELKLVLERSGQHDNIFMQPLTVLRQVDLNLNPEYLLPLKEEQIKYFCCWPCTSGPIISTLTIPHSGYVPGQGIKYRLEVDNQSYGNDLSGIKVKLMQTFKYTAHHPHHKMRHDSKILMLLHQNERCWRLSKHLFEGTLDIPAATVASSKQGDIIQLAYHLELSVRTGDCHTDSVLNVPITIGTIPLWQCETTDCASLKENSTDLPPSYEKYKPPSFEEATISLQSPCENQRNTSNSNQQIEWLFQQPTSISDSMLVARVKEETNINAPDVS